MARNSKTRQLVEANLGQHVALPVAAHLARSQLVPDPLAIYDAQHLMDVLDRVGVALARVAPLYVQDAKTSTPCELLPAELLGAVVRQGATCLVLRDGRKLASVSLKRADLRQAIAILKAVGVQNVTAPRRAAPAPSAPDPLLELCALADKIEALLQPPRGAEQLSDGAELALARLRTELRAIP